MSIEVSKKRKILAAIEACAEGVSGRERALNPKLGPNYNALVRERIEELRQAIEWLKELLEQPAQGDLLPCPFCGSKESGQ